MDARWYYIIPGPFRIKIPFELIEHCLETDEHEFDYCNQIEHLVVESIFNEYKNTHPEFVDFLRLHYSDIDSISEKISKSSSPIYVLFKDYNKIFNYFDDWILIIADKTGKEVSEIIIRKKEEQHLETFMWKN